MNRHLIMAMIFGEWERESNIYVGRILNLICIIQENSRGSFFQDLESLTIIANILLE